MTKGYLDSPWPSEDGSPQRLAIAGAASGLDLGSGRALQSKSRRTLLSTMTVLGAHGEVYLLTHSALRAKVGLATTARVERLDPVTLETLEQSPRLAGGPMWPGGIAVHRNGDLYVVYGQYVHRLDRQCQPKASFKLPVVEPHNSFVILNNGLIVTKNLSDVNNAILTVLDPDTMKPAALNITCPEPSIARLSAVENTVYVVGVRSIFRYHWNEGLGSLQKDADWHWTYQREGQTFGWDVVLDGTSAWFMDNGKHKYQTTMRGAGVGINANRLLRVDLADCARHQALEVCGLPRGSITNPPLVDTQRRIVVAFDSANGYLAAWRYAALGEPLAPLWQKPDFWTASHMLQYPTSGELIVNYYRRWREHVVILDIETGEEKGRVSTGGFMQGVVFPSVGWSGDLYWCSMDRVTRVFSS